MRDKIRIRTKVGQALFVCGYYESRRIKGLQETRDLASKVTPKFHGNFMMPREKWTHNLSGGVIARFGV